MAAYLIASYDVKDPDTYAKYNPGSLETIMGTIAKHGGKVLSAGDQSTWLASSRHAVVIIEFPDVAAAQAWEDDPDYAPVKQFRLDSTENRIEFVAPSLG